IGPRAIAGLWHKLLHETLNYRRPFGAQGGDWGAVVSSWLAFDYPLKEEKDEGRSGALGLHLNMVGLRPGIDLAKTKFSAAEEAWLDKVQAERDDKTAYQRIQATRPQTLGVALTDSPVGLAAWIVEKFQAWSDCAGDPLNRFTMDLLLDNIMVYWLTGTAGTATWLYRGVTLQQPRALPEGKRVETPTAFAAFPADLAPPPPREWIERCYNLRRHTIMPKGGHFAALEEPELLVEDIRAFFRPLRFGAAND
ncbi:MAG: alpha/beta fold hydrolase, partial [Reyranellales bacterium]